MTMQRHAVAYDESGSPLDIHDPPARRCRRRSDDTFFEAGDRIALRNGFGASGLVAIFCLTKEENDQAPKDRISSNPGTPMRPMMDDEAYENEPQPLAETPSFSNRGYPCVVCHKSFPTHLDCETHYENSHVHECHACHAVLPNTRLLDLHLLEAHDAYFAASVSKGGARYSCLVPKCTSSGFPNDLERHRHLMQSHGYPNWFRFLSRRKRPNRSDEELRKKKSKWTMQRSRNGAAPTPFSRSDCPMETAPLDKRVRRRERQMRKRGQTPCKFYSSKSGCWRGSSCMFLHEGSATDTAAEGDSMDVVDEMATKLSKVALVPNSVRFGRAKRR